MEQILHRYGVGNKFGGWKQELMFHIISFQTKMLSDQNEKNRETKLYILQIAHLSSFINNQFVKLHK